ncbi:uncharacterized protein LOC111401019 [Olea europaea var. sylvestris]|uniref:uncharacterized protein LOC111401019 n=1 Tax=Olea europaea var. sylvestris TaxID=158386 RepID=UPI000C1D2701|nr:uncharacterized protein LOC111401019 [Olea europaea var. sylvestris]
MEKNKFEVRQILKSKKFWFTSFLIAWAAALQGHIMWLQRQDSFKKKFGDHKQDAGSEEGAENQNFSNS